MLTHSQIVKRAGGAEKVAEIHGVSINTVRSWVQRNSIPADQWIAFANAKHATLRELAEAAHAKAKAA